MEQKESREYIREMLISDNVKKAFQAISNMAESLGGNASSLKDGRAKGAYNCFFSEKTGLIIAFGNEQDFKSSIIKKTITAPGIVQGALVIAFDLCTGKHPRDAQPSEAIDFYIYNEKEVSVEAVFILEETRKRLNVLLQSHHREQWGEPNTV